MPPKQITYADDDYCTAEIEVHRATALIGMRRTRLKLQGQESGETDADRRLLRTYTYPDVVSASSGPITLNGKTVDAGGLDFETFLRLPDVLCVRWEDAVYQQNPHWMPQSADPKAVAPTPPPKRKRTRSTRAS